VSLARLVQAGIVPITTNVALSELHRTWNRPDAAKWAELYGLAVPNYRAAIDSFQKAAEVGGKR
jgi:hypothetical protein